MQVYIYLLLPEFHKSCEGNLQIRNEHLKNIKYAEKVKTQYRNWSIHDYIIT
jgi:hypothetical protein